MLSRLRARDEREKEQMVGMEKFILSQARKAREKQEASSKNREAKLKILRDRLRERNQHIEEVKEAKKSGKSVTFTSQPSVGFSAAHDELPAFRFGGVN